MRLASQPHCLWGETGSIPVRGAIPRRTRSGTAGCKPVLIRAWCNSTAGDFRHGSQSHGDQPSLQNSERRFDSFATRDCLEGRRPHGSPGPGPPAPFLGRYFNESNPALARQGSGCKSRSLHRLVGDFVPPHAPLARRLAPEREPPPFSHALRTGGVARAKTHERRCSRKPRLSSSRIPGYLSPVTCPLPPVLVGDFVPPHAPLARRLAPEREPPPFSHALRTGGVARAKTHERRCSRKPRLSSSRIPGYLSPVTCPLLPVLVGDFVPPHAPLARRLAPEREPPPFSHALRAGGVARAKTHERRCSRARRLASSRSRSRIPLALALAFPATCHLPPAPCSCGGLRPPSRSCRSKTRFRASASPLLPCAPRGRRRPCEDARTTVLASAASRFLSLSLSHSRLPVTCLLLPVLVGDFVPPHALLARRLASEREPPPFSYALRAGGVARAKTHERRCSRARRLAFLSLSLSHSSRSRSRIPDYLSPASCSLLFPKRGTRTQTQEPDERERGMGNGAPPQAGTPKRQPASLSHPHCLLPVACSSFPVPNSQGAVAQSGEHLDGIEKVTGAIPVGSTTSNAGEDYIPIMVLR